MSELCAWDLDGTIRPGSLLGDAVLHGIEAGFIDPAKFAEPSNPTYPELPHFMEAIKGRSRTDFKELTDRLTEEAIQHAYPWAVETLEEQGRTKHPIIISHGLDFAVKAFARGLPGVKHAQGSYYHTSKLVFSGHEVTLNKHRSLSRHMRTRGFNELGFAAGDTMNDLPLLERARHGVVVNPNDELASLAESRGWEIVRLPAHASPAAAALSVTLET